MGKQASMPQHPLVKAYMAGERILELPWEDAFPESGLGRAIHGARAAFHKELSWEQGMDLLRSVRLEAIADPEVTMLYLATWAEACFRARRLAEMEALINRFRALVGRDTLPELKALLLTQEGLLASGQGNKLRRIDLLGQAIEVLPPESSSYCGQVDMRAFFLAQIGRLADADQDLESLYARGESRIRSDVALVRFVGEIECFRVEEAARCLPEIQADPRNARRLGGDHLAYRELFQTVTEKWDPARRPQSAADELTEEWAVTSDRLYRRRPAEALECARRMAADGSGREVVAVGLDSFDLLRAELANRNGQAARRILELRRAAGNVHYLESFFRARVELLAGDREAAARHFAVCAADCERYRARARLEFELLLSCELLPADVLWLGQAMLRRPAAVETPTEPVGSARGAERLIGASRALAGIREAAARMAGLDAPVLVTGETGTGKELVARALHESGPRSREPFVAVNCGAITESLLESELFGHVRGAFTGAQRAHRGIFEAAGRGTVLLDEIGDIPPRLQAALLRVLEAGEIRPVGSASSRTVACRIVAATNADLDALAAARRFRPDLLYRLRHLAIHIPPLRERTEDVLPLAAHFLGLGRREGQRPVIGPGLRARLLANPWPGNVRELRSVIERMRLLNSDKLSYDAEDLDPFGQPSAAPAPARPPVADEPQPPSPSAPAAPAPTAGGVEEFLRAGRSPLRRRQRVRELFRQHGQLTRAELAAILGISPFTITRDLKALANEGLIEKHRPTASPRTHYFALKRVRDT